MRERERERNTLMKNLILSSNQFVQFFLLLSFSSPFLESLPILHSMVFSSSFHFLMSYTFPARDLMT